MAKLVLILPMQKSVIQKSLTIIQTLCLAEVRSYFLRNCLDRYLHFFLILKVWLKMLRDMFQDEFAEIEIDLSEEAPANY